MQLFGNLRWGELAGQHRRNLDLGFRTVRIVETVYELDRFVKGTPKSEASTRKITLPELIMPQRRRHLETVTPHHQLGKLSMLARDAGDTVSDPRNHLTVSDRH